MRNLCAKSREALYKTNARKSNRIAPEIDLQRRISQKFERSKEKKEQGVQFVSVRNFLPRVFFSPHAAPRPRTVRNNESLYTVSHFVFLRRTGVLYT